MRAIDNLRCMFKHRWVYKTETCVTHPPKVIVSNTMFGNGFYMGPCDGNGDPLPVTYDRDIRICERCKKKERKDMNFNHRYPNPKWVTTWVDCDLTQSDVRDNKLDQILK